MRTYQEAFLSVWMQKYVGEHLDAQWRYTPGELEPREKWVSRSIGVGGEWHISGLERELYTRCAVNCLDSLQRHCHKNGRLVVDPPGITFEVQPKDGGLNGYMVQWRVATVPASPFWELAHYIDRVEGTHVQADRKLPDRTPL